MYNKALIFNLVRIYKKNCWETDAIIIIPSQILTTAVISILMTAPIGAILIGVTGPRLLRRVEQVKPNENDRTEMKSLVSPESV